MDDALGNKVPYPLSTASFHPVTQDIVFDTSTTADESIYIRAFGESGVEYFYPFHLLVCGGEKVIRIDGPESLTYNYFKYDSGPGLIQQ
jgi:hypothetical protein